jgi:hypothetical protein
MGRCKKARGFLIVHTTLTKAMMKAIALTAGTLMMSAAGADLPKPTAEEAQPAKPLSLFLTQRRWTPDTSTPGSTAPGNAVNSRPVHASQKDQSYAAELRRCEAIGETAERAACRYSARSRFGEM